MTRRSLDTAQSSCSKRGSSRRSGRAIRRQEFRAHPNAALSDHASFWEPYVRYLIYAHLSVIAAGAALEFLFDYGRYYELFYWIYLVSMMIALVAFVGLKLKRFMETQDRPHVPDSVYQFEIAIARYAEHLIWVSLSIFAATVLVRIALGIHRAAVYLQSTPS